MKKGTPFCFFIIDSNYEQFIWNFYQFVAEEILIQNIWTKYANTNEPDFQPLKQGSNWQHQLGLACLYPWHIIMSALHHDWQRKFNQLPCSVKTFRISIYSATTSKNFMQIAHHLNELWKKQKGVLFMKHRVNADTTTTTTTIVLLLLQLQLKIRDISFTEAEL